jgi:hypothetical protein
MTTSSTISGTVSSTIADATNHLVDVYPQVVGEHVDISAVDVNDNAQTAVVHFLVTRLWLKSSGRPQPRRLSVLACRGLSPESTDAMTYDEVSYSRMVNYTSFTAAKSVDAGRTTNEEYR